MTTSQDSIRLHQVPRNARIRCGGYSFVEFLGLTAAITVIASIAMNSLTNVKSSADDLKLATDVKTLNSAVGVYLAFGSLDGLTEPQQVLDKLKTVVNEDLRRRMPGIAGSVIDPRLEAMTTSDIPDKDFAEWDPAAQRFKIVSDGVATQLYKIETFVLGDEPTAEVKETRSPTLHYSRGDGWVWDYEDRSPLGRIGPTSFSLASVSPVIPPSTLPTANLLSAPLFSIVGGTYPAVDFDLPLTLSNPNPPGVGEILYSVNGGAFTVYDGSPVSVSPGDTISAYSRSLDPTAWNDSSARENSYAADLSGGIGFSMSASLVP